MLMVDGEEMKRLRQLESDVWNLLGVKEPKQVADWINGAVAELRHLRQLERVVLNQLGTTDPKQVAEWLVRLAGGRPAWNRPRVVEEALHVTRCAPQADGASEQDVIGLLTHYTTRVSEVASRGNHSAPGSDSLTSEPPARTCVETLDHLDRVIADVESRGSC